MGDGEGVREGSPDHAARVRCSMVAGLHPGALLPISLYGNGSGRPLPHPPGAPRTPRVAQRCGLLPPPSLPSRQGLGLREERIGVGSRA